MEVCQNIIESYVELQNKNNSLLGKNLELEEKNNVLLKENKQMKKKLKKRFY